jgi:hypothetical protein
MNAKGQEEAGFRLLIEAVLVVFILVIILGVVSQIDQWRWRVSEKQLYEGFVKSLNSPDGSVIVQKNLVLKDGASYSSRAFAEATAGIEADCIELDASGNSAFSLNQNRKVITINTLIQTDVYYKCLPGTAVGEASCETYCVIGFSKDLA